jgi:hypothetical protein
MSLISFFKNLNTWKAWTCVLFVFICRVDGTTQSVDEPRAFIHWQNPKTKASAVHALIRNLEGNLVFVGTTNKKGKDISFVVADTSGLILKDTVIIGGDKNDEANAVCNTRDGGFLIAGYTRSSKLHYVGASDGWVVKTDFNGKPLWEALLGTAGEDVFTSVAEDAKGNFFVTGQSNNALWVVKISSKGAKLWERRIEGFARQGRSIAFSRRTGLAVVTGFETVGRVETLYLTGFDGTGKTVFDKPYPDAAGEKIIEMPNGNWLVAGRRYTVKTDQDMLLLQTDSVGVAIQSHTFGGNWEDGAQALAFDPISNTVCLAGYTHSQVHYAHNSQLWLLKSDLQGNEAWKKRAYFGNNDNEGANDLLLTPEGQLFAIAYTGVEKKPWLLGFGTIIHNPDVKKHKGLSTEQGIVLENDSVKAVFEPNERGFYEFVLTNNSSSPIYPLSATVSPTKTPAQGLWVLPKLEIGALRAGESRHITIPLSITDSVASDTSRFVVNFFVKNEEVGKATSFDVVTKAVLRPRLKIIEHVFNSDTTTIIDANGDIVLANSKKLILNLKVQNTGNTQSEETKVKFICPPNIKYLTSQTVDLGVLQTNTEGVARFEFQPEGTFEDSTIEIRVVAIEKTRQGDSYEDVSFMFRKKQNTSPILSSPNYSFDTSPVGKQESQSFLNILWQHPNPVEHGSTEFREEKQEMTLKIGLQSNKPIEDSLIYVYLNGNRFQGAKAKVKPIRCLPDENNNYNCFFEKTILLEKGMNTIEVKAKNGTIEKSVQKLKVNCEVKKPNLYILAIGVPFKDLLFSTKDAQDFAQIWQNQEGKLFEKVTILIRNTEGVTNMASIRQAIMDLRKQEVSPHDYLMIYISSHGFLDDDDQSFSIETVDHSLTTSSFINFEHDVLKRLLPIKCQQLLFVDACRSGKAMTLSQKIASILETKTNNFMCILSSDANEFSYEDEKWQNSAFTKAIIEALNNQNVEAKEGTIVANINKDNSLTIEELMTFLQKRVPFMVKKQKGMSQTPSMFPKTGEKTKNELEIYKFKQ